MLLLSLIEWVGPGRRHPDRVTIKPTERHVGMITRMGLGEALLHLRRYEEAYAERYLLATEFRLLAVSLIENLTVDEIDAIRIEDLDKLSIDGHPLLTRSRH